MISLEKRNKNCLKRRQFGQNNFHHRLWKVAQSAINRQSGHTGCLSVFADGLNASSIVSTLSFWSYRLSPDLRCFGVFDYIFLTQKLFSLAWDRTQGSLEACLRRCFKSPSTSSPFVLLLEASFYTYYSIVSHHLAS